MNQPERRDEPVDDNRSGEEQTYTPPQPQEKTSLGGDFNSGVTSHDPAEKDEIEKKGALANIDQSAVRTEEERKTEEGRS
ncbi:MAG: hypothetical protein WCF67_18105 [Chitinophagaceae bacterium]